MDIFNEGDKTRVGISKYLNEKRYRWIREERAESEWRHVVVALAVGSTVMQNLLDGRIFEYAALRVFQPSKQRSRLYLFSYQGTGIVGILRMLGSLAFCNKGKI
jgi:hypothetical protein